MNLGALLGEMLQQGMAGPAQSRMRQGASQSGAGIEQVLGALLGGGGAQGGGSGGGIGDLLGAMLGGAQSGAGGAQRSTGIDAMGSLSGPAAPGQGAGGGGLADLLGAALGGAQSAQRSSQSGGIGDLLGAVLGGGAATGAAGGAAGGGMGDLLGAMLGGGGQRGGAAGGAAMAVLGGLAMSALKNFAAQPAAAQAVAPHEARALVDADAEALVLSAMISAMKADGAIDDAEVAKLEKHLNRDGVTQGEIDFVHAEMAKPVDVAGLAARARSPASAAQLYAASVVAITIDTETERAYLRALAQALRLDGGTVARLHQMTGAPAV